MTRRQQLKNRRIIRIVSAVLLAVLCVIGAVVLFNIFKSNIEKELDEYASEGIKETYKEAGELIDEISKSRMNYLKIISDNLDDSNKLVNSIDDYKELCGFTQFYFLNDDGEFITLDNLSGKIDFDDNLLLINNKKENDLIIDGALEGGEEMIFYITDVENDSFNDFEYTFISFGYDKKDMVNSLKIDAYNGESISYITYGTGKIICRIDDNTIAKNVLTILKYSNASEDIYHNVEEDINHGKAGTVRIKGQDDVDGFGEYYFSYQPLNYQDWMLVSLTPVSAVNKTADLIRSQTTTVVIGIFSCVIFIVFCGVFFTFRNIMKNKDGLIIQRNIVFDLVCNNLNEIYILFNTKTAYVEYVSPNTEKLLGIAHTKIYDNPQNYNIYKDEKVISLDKLIHDLIDDEKLDLKDDVYLKDGHNKDVLYSLASYRPSNGLYGVIVLSDRTEENRVRQELQDALEGAKSANEAKTAFLSNVSHDMRTPMNAIVGFSDLIEKDPTNASQVMDYILKIKLSSHHLLNLINEVLDYSKIEAGKTTLNLESINIETVVNSIDSLIRPQAIEKNQNFNIKADYGRHCLVKADELRLNQILINILSNAIKYTPNGGTIDFDIKGEKYHQFMHYTFVIKDTGLGMSKEFVERIFEPFSREEDSITNKIQGTGLGMSITKNLIDLMGGSIDIESKKGEGSTFRVSLYFEEDELLDQTIKINTKDIKEDYSISGLNILAAEDNDLNAEIIKAIIESEGATIDIVEDGKKCLDKFVSSKINEYDLILMDVQMPVMDGYDATMAIRNSKHSKAKTIPIIAMTANAFSEDVNKSLKAGMNAHVSKPIDIKLLKKTIRDCLNK